MTLSKYHQNYADQPDEVIDKKAAAKRQELITIFKEVELNTNSDPIRIAVLGCGDRRFIAHHNAIFENVLKKNVEVITFDITVEHLQGEKNVIRHDCTLPLPNGPYDMIYGHVLLKFIETDKQYAALKYSFDALKPGGIAIHCFDWEEIRSGEEKLPDGLWSVPLEQYKQKLKNETIPFVEISLQYGPALVLIRS